MTAREGPRWTSPQRAGAADEIILEGGKRVSWRGRWAAVVEKEWAGEGNDRRRDGGPALSVVLVGYGDLPDELPQPGAPCQECSLVGFDMRQGHHVSWSPASQSAQGGTTEYHVTISTHPVGPSLTPHPTVLINRPSLHQYEPQVHGGGLIIYDSSLIDTTPTRGDVETIAIPATDIADGRGWAQAANMVALALS